MAFGWFGKDKQGGTKALEKAHKLVTQARWAEALSYYHDAGTDPTIASEAQQGARRCREQLVSWNLEEAAAFQRGGEPLQAVEHAELALELAGEEEDLAAKARSALAKLDAPEPEPAPQRMFEPSCGCAAPCTSPGDGEAEEHTAGEELFEFYLESLSDIERQVLEHLDVEFQRGFVALQQGELERARQLLEATAAANGDLPGPSYALGLLEAVAGNVEEALEQFQYALDRDPELAPATHHRADLLCEVERFGEAALLLDGWLATHPNDVDALFLLARCQERAGDLDEALQTLDLAAERAPEFQARLALARAALLHRRGDTDAALKAYQQTVARNPNLVEALVPLGQLLSTRGGADAESAVEVFKHCRRLDPERGWWYLLQVAGAYAARGHREQARELLETAREELPDSDAARTEFDAMAQRVEN